MAILIPKVASSSHPRPPLRSARLPAVYALAAWSVRQCSRHCDLLREKVDFAPLSHKIAAFNAHRPAPENRNMKAVAERPVHVASTADFALLTGSAA
jgi:hypothetical protein